jgi:hypothetical protein
MVQNDEQGRVGPLKKVVVLLEAGVAADRLDFAPGAVRSVFIYGLGMSGLSPLERAISEKREGDECLLRLGRNELPDFFQHIIIPPLKIPETVEAFTLKITVAEVCTPDPREVVRAMADMANCGNQCCGH